MILKYVLDLVDIMVKKVKCFYRRSFYFTRSELCRLVSYDVVFRGVGIEKFDIFYNIIKIYLNWKYFKVFIIGEWFCKFF